MTSELARIREKNAAIAHAYEEIIDGCIDEHVVRTVAFLLERKREQMDAFADVAAHM